MGVPRLLLLYSQQTANSSVIFVLLDCVTTINCFGCKENNIWNTEQPSNIDFFDELGITL